MKNRFLFNIHSIAGLASGLFILLMSLSGSVLIFHDELDGLQQPYISYSQSKKSSIDNCYFVIQKKYPNAQISNCTIPGEGNQPVSFIIYDSSYKNGKAGIELFLHPQTATILKTSGSGNSFAGWLSKFHRSFYLGKTGEWLLGCFAIIFLISIITGCILYRKKILPALLFKKEIYKWNNLHQLIAVYALIFNLMIAITGFWMQRYVFKKEFYATNKYTSVLKASAPLPFKFDEAYVKLQNKYPDFTASVIYFAQSNKGKTALYGSRSSNAYIHSKKFADVIFLDSTGNIAKIRFVNEIAVADRYDIINSQLHMGRFGGIGIKIIYLLFGLTGSLLSITGFLLWYKRKKRNS